MLSMWVLSCNARGNKHGVGKEKKRAEKGERVGGWWTFKNSRKKEQRFAIC